MTADTVGGVWTYALDLARALERQGVETALATMGAPLSRAQWTEVESVPGLEVYESRFRLEWMNDPWEDVLASGEWLLSLEAKLRPDIVHLNGYAHGALPWRAPCLVVGHSCVLSWWRAVKGANAPPEWGRYRDAVARGLGAAGLVVAPTEAMLNALTVHYGSVPRARVIWNGREGRMFRPRAKENVIFSAGRVWDEAKNISTLDEVAGDLPWPVIVAGDTRHPDGREAPQGAVYRLGHLSPARVAEHMAVAAIYALPARYEPFGLSALEAALCGCALVLGDIPSLREVWEDAALFVPPDDTEALRSALRRLIDDGTLREAMAARARYRAHDFSPRLMADGYLAAYEELLAERKPSGKEPACA